MYNIFTAETEILIPTYQSEFSAGADLRAAEYHQLAPQETKLIDTGVKFDVNSEAYHIFKSSLCALIYIRSSLALRGLILVNGVGVIDIDYPDTIKLLVKNTTEKPFEIEKFERIGQIILQQIHRFAPIENKKRIGGFGSTNKI